MFVYKILTKQEWETFQIEGEFSGTPLDLRDGYIHMSFTQKQIDRILNKYYKDQSVVILEIDLRKLENIKFESCRDDTYPHLYDKLKIEDVTLTRTQ